MSTETRRRFGTRWSWLTFAGPIVIMLLVVVLGSIGVSPIDLHNALKPNEESVQLGYGSSDADVRGGNQTGASIVFDFGRNALYIKMGDVVMRKCAMQVLDDSSTVKSLLKEWKGVDSSRCVVDRVHLYSGVPMLTPAELGAIAETFEMREDQVQRYTPAEMVIGADSEINIRIVTDAEGKPLSSVGNFTESLHLLWGELTGTKSIRIHLAGPDAMSVYGLSLNHPHLYIEG